MNWEVVTGDSLEWMRARPDASVDAIVTSPPYADQRTYEEGADGGTPYRSGGEATRALKARSRRERSEAPALFPGWLRPFTREMLRVLSPTGSLMLNLGVVLRDGEEHDCMDRVLADCREDGWRLLHRTIWHKLNGQTPSDRRFLTIAHEWVFWLAPSVDAYRGYDRDTRTPHAASSVRRIEGPYNGAGKHEGYAKQGKVHQLHPDGARPTTVFSCGVGGRPNPNRHAARMALPLALRLVSLSCPPGGLVLDPFAGDGTTGVACARRDRDFVGVELSPRSAAGARERIRDDAGMLGVEPPPTRDDQMAFEG